MFVWARLPDGWDASDLLPRALERDVAYVLGAPVLLGRA
jgi:2-aminoadipate transaminase